jgi:hypothetical protein
MAGGPPGSPATTDVWVATTIGANNECFWVFMYDNSEATYKWKYIGGTPVANFVDADETTTSATYVALGTAGPSFTIPRSGDYDVLIACNQQQDGGTGKSYMSYDIGGTGAVDADGAWMNNPGAAVQMNFTTSRLRRKTGLAASTALVSKYRTASGGQMHAANRIMVVTPIRII